MYLDACVNKKHESTFAAVTKCPVIWSVEVTNPITLDDDLFKFCAENHHVFVTEDKKQRRNDYLVSVAREAKIGIIEVRFKRTSFEDKDAVYAANLESLCELARHPAPFLVLMTRQGFRFVPLGAYLWRDRRGIGQQAQA